MTASLADSLDVVLPDLPRELVPAAAEAPIRDLAARLAPVAHCGFEVRLAGDAGSEVDFQQGVFAREGQPDVLLEHLGPGHPASQLVARWAGGSLPLEELWLEFDAAERVSVFAGFTRRPMPSEERKALVLETLGLLAWERPAAVERVLDACQDPAYVSHVGVMLGRRAPFVRVNVKRLPPAVLGVVGWPGPLEQAATVMRRLGELCDHVTVCLDVGDRVRERIGFECMLDAQPADEPRWGALLDELVGEGLCTHARRDALLAWPGLVTPTSERPRWPAHLVAAGLLQPPDRFSALERRLSHVKVTLEPGGEREAKGYFGYLHTWVRPPAGPDEARPGRLRRRPGSPAERAVAFLGESRTRAGWWQDFEGGGRGVIGPSDAWVSAYVATAVAPVAPTLAERVWTLLLERQLPTGGWGWSRVVGADADSTAWALRLAAAIGREAPPASSAFLSRHVLPAGALSTYLDESLPPGANGGWTRTGHADVAAAAAPFLPGVLGWLRDAQAGDGGWHAYWWEAREYATALAAEALAGSDHARVDAAVEWAKAQPTTGSAFKLALRARILALRGEQSPLLDALAELQEADGGWPASARLRIPGPDAIDPETATVFRLDAARLFTTATALSVLG